MLRVVPPVVILFLFCSSITLSAEKDYLKRGERQPHGEWEAPYIRGIHHVLSRAWRKDVVVRMLDIPPFQNEWAVGISRGDRGYRAFSVTASKFIWSALTPGSSAKRKREYRSIAPIVREKEISDSLATRIAAVWRRLLADPADYGKDPGLYLDTDQFSFYVGFLPHENLAANTTGWGSKGGQVINVASALDLYAKGKANENDLAGAVKKAERKLGIK